MFFYQERDIARSRTFFGKPGFREFGWSLSAGNRSNSHIHVWGHAGTSLRPQRLTRAAYALTGSRGSRYECTHSKITRPNLYSKQMTFSKSRILQFSGISRFLTQRIWCLPADIALRVLEVELEGPAPASECARRTGKTRWPQRRPSMTPDVYVTPGSIHSTQRPSKSPKSLLTKKSTSLFT